MKLDADSERPPADSRSVPEWVMVPAAPLSDPPVTLYFVPDTLTPADFSALATPESSLSVVVPLASVSLARATPGTAQNGSTAAATNAMVRIGSSR